MKLLQTWGRTERPWGYEIRVDFEDDDGMIHNEVMTFPSEPKDEDVDGQVAAIQTRLETRKEDTVESVQAVIDETTAKIEELQAKVDSLSIIKTAISEAKALVDSESVIEGGK